MAKAAAVCLAGPCDVPFGWKLFLPGCHVMHQECRQPGVGGEDVGSCRPSFQVSEGLVVGTDQLGTLAEAAGSSLLKTLLLISIVGEQFIVNNNMTIMNIPGLIPCCLVLFA